MSAASIESRIAESAASWPVSASSSCSCFMPAPFAALVGRTSIVSRPWAGAPLFPQRHAAATVRGARACSHGDDSSCKNCMGAGGVGGFFFAAHAA